MVQLIQAARSAAAIIACLMLGTVLAREHLADRDSPSSDAYLDSEDEILGTPTFATSNSIPTTVSFPTDTLVTSVASPETAGNQFAQAHHRRVYFPGPPGRPKTWYNPTGTPTTTPYRTVTSSASRLCWLGRERPNGYHSRQREPSGEGALGGFVVGLTGGTVTVR